MYKVWAMKSWFVVALMRADRRAVVKVERSSEEEDEGRKWDLEREYIPFRRRETSESLQRID